MFMKKRTLCCRFCFTDLWLEHTFIKCANAACAEFGISLCLQCFAAGTGDDVHKNTDPYQVLCNAIIVGDHLWAAHEEITLLDTFVDTMSWEKVARKLDRSPQECEYHYFENYVFYPKIKGLENANKNAFRFDKFDKINTNMTTSIGNTLDLEGTYLFLIQLSLSRSGYMQVCNVFLMVYLVSVIFFWCYKDSPKAKPHLYLICLQDIKLISDHLTGHQLLLLGKNYNIELYFIVFGILPLFSNTFKKILSKSSLV